MKQPMHLTLIPIIIGGSIYISDFEIDKSWERVLIGVTLFLATIYASFLGAYAKEIGKNLATKEDIRAITKITEEIKRDVELVSENRISFQAMKREAILNYYDTYIQWINYLMNALIQDTDEPKSITRADELMYNYNNAASRLVLFDDRSGEYSHLTHEIANITANLQAKYLIDLHEYIHPNSYTPLRQDIVTSFNQHRIDEHKKIMNLLRPLVPTLRERIRGTVNPDE